MDRLKRMLNENNGVLKTADVVAAGIPKDYLYKFVKEAGMEKAAHGIFISPDAFVDEMYLLQLQFPKAIFSHDTALYLHDLAEMEPMPLTVTVPHKYRSVALIDKGVEIIYTKPEWHEIGVCTATSPAGFPIRVYDKERTICDVVRRRNHMDVYAFNYAVRQYIRSNASNHLQLLQYAKEFKMERQLRDVIGVLL